MPAEEAMAAYTFNFTFVSLFVWKRYNPRVISDMSTVARHIFQACPVWIYTQSNITQASYSPEYITPTQQITWSRFVIVLMHWNKSL
jgi:hypothetical protein